MFGERRGTATVRVPCPLVRTQLPELYADTCELLGRGDCELLLCEVSGVAADAVAVDALARLALAARRNNCEVRLCGASAELCRLLDFTGLAGVLRGELPAPS
jgi:ABC-type transporter Mla MlaB component